MDRFSDERLEGLARDVLDNLLEGCQVIGFDWRYLFLNDAAVRQAHRPLDELLGRTMMECFPGIETTPMFGILTRCMRERVHARMENEFTYPDGSTGWFELRFVPVPKGACILSLDMTEARRTAQALVRSEAQFRQAQKMEAVGRLAGGVAHDFNNLLTAILGHAQLVGRRPNLDAKVARDVLEIERAAVRAAALTRQLLAFNRQQKLEPRVLDLNRVIVDLDRLLRRLIGADLDLVTAPSPDLGRVRADPGQLEQALMNLVVNARDAMPTGGKLTIETANVTLEARDALGRSGLTPGAYVMLAVSDTGIGMDEATRSQIFEPFFTTKEVGRGTGLGLSTVHGIVEQSGGHIEVYSEVGHGSTFKIYLPLVEAALDSAPPERPSPRTLVGDETILVVEDDELVRGVVERTLSEHGYTVIQALDRAEAVRACEACERSQVPMDLVLSDVVMPGMSVAELIDRLRAARPRTRILYMSGYPDRAMSHHGWLDPDHAYLQKPFTVDGLLRKVRDVLEAPPAHGA